MWKSLGLIKFCIVAKDGGRTNGANNKPRVIGDRNEDQQVTTKTFFVFTSGGSQAPL
jgi:hypothetical protein